MNLLFAQLALAGGIDLAGCTPRDAAMAGAGGDDPACIAHDPAAVGFVDGETAAVGYRVTFGSKPVHALDAAAALSRPIGRYDLAAGASLYLPFPAVDANITRLDTDPVAPALDDAADFLAIDLAAAIRRGPLSVALGVEAGIDAVGDTEVHLNSIAGEETPDGWDLTESTTVDTTRRFVWAATPLVGVAVRAEHGAAWAAWRGASDFRVRGDTDVYLDLGALDIDVIELPLDYVAAWSAPTARAGVELAVGPVRPALVVRYARSSAWRDSQNRDPIAPVHDTVSPAAGVEVAVDDVRLRAGYALIPRFAEPPYRDPTRHVLGAGAAWKPASVAVNAHLFEGGPLVTALIGVRR